MKKYFSYIAILLIFFATGCLEEGTPLFSIRNIHSKIMVTNDSAYLNLSAEIDTATFRGIEYAEIQGNIYDISDSVELVSYGHCWRVNSTEDTTLLYYPVITDSRSYFDIKSDTVETSPDEKQFTFKSDLMALEIEHQYFVRSFVLTRNKNTGKIDTGYNQTVTKFNTKIPQDVWFYIGDLQQGDVREDATSFVLNEDGKDYAYFTTGWDGFQLKDDTWKYDYETNTWQQKAQFRGGDREKAVAFVIDKGMGKGEEAYVGTGSSDHYDPKPERDIYKYNPGQNLWSTGIDSLQENTERYDAVAFTLTVQNEEGNDVQKGYIALGKRTYPRDDIYEYDYESDTAGHPYSAWTKKDLYPGGVRSEAVVAVINNQAVVGFGLTRSSTTSEELYTNDFYIYDPTNTSNTWRSITNCPGEPRANAIAFGLSFERDGIQNNLIYVGTGRGDNNGADTLYNDLWAYDLNQNMWLPKSEIREDFIIAFAREGAIAFTINKDDVFYGTNIRGFVTLGRNKEGTSGMTKLWEYLP